MRIKELGKIYVSDIGRKNCSKAVKELIKKFNKIKDLKNFDEMEAKIKAETPAEDWWEWIPHLKRQALEEKAKVTLCEEIGYVEPVVHCSDVHNPSGNTWLYALMNGSDVASYDARIEMYELYTGQYKCKNVHRRDYPMMYCQYGY